MIDFLKNLFRHLFWEVWIDDISDKEGYTEERKRRLKERLQKNDKDDYVF